MSRTRMHDLPLDETLDSRAMEDVRGGIIAILIGVVSPRDPASGLPTGQRMHKPFVPGPAVPASPYPTEQVSFNFQKIPY